GWGEGRSEGGAENELFQFRAQFRGAHAPSRALFGALSERISSSTGFGRRDADRCSRGGCAPQPLGQNPLRRFSKINVPARQPRNQLIVTFTREIDFRRARRVLVAQSIEPSLEPVHTLRIASGILRAMITVVPV